MIDNMYSKKISEIEPIDSQEVMGYDTKNVIVRDREDLRKIIEAPCLAACMALYDKNIRTVNSSANKNNVGRKAFITIDYDSLDENNKKRLNELVEKGIISQEKIDSVYDKDEHVICIEIPICEEDTVGIVSDKFMQIVANFQEQDVLYGKVHTNIEGMIDYLTNYHFDELEELIDENGNVFQDDLERLVEKYKDEFIEILEACGYYYDEESDTFWQTEELYRKHKRYQEKQKAEIKSQEEVNQ